MTIQSDLDAIMLLETAQEDISHEEFIGAFQWLIDTGTVWHLQGAYQRAAHDLIEGGHCHAPA